MGLFEQRPTAMRGRACSQSAVVMGSTRYISAVPRRQITRDRQAAVLRSLRVRPSSPTHRQTAHHIRLAMTAATIPPFVIRTQSYRIPHASHSVRHYVNSIMCALHIDEPTFDFSGSPDYASRQRSELFRSKFTIIHADVLAMLALPSGLIQERNEKFVSKFACCHNLL